MSALENHPDGPDEAYLAAATDYMAARLRLHAGRRAPSQPVAGAATDGAGSAIQQGLAAVEAHLIDLEVSDPPPHFIQLARAFGLTRFESELLLLCVAAERSPELLQLCEAAQPGRNTPHPTFALALELFADPDRTAMLPDRPLRYYRLVTLFQPDDRLLVTSAIGADEHVVAYAHGATALDGWPRLDSMLAQYIRPLSDEGSDLPLGPTHRQITDDVAAHFKSAAGGAGLAQLAGADHWGKIQIAAAAMKKDSARRLYCLSADQLPVNAADLETLTRLWARDCRLHRLALFVDATHAPATGADATTAGARPALMRCLAACARVAPAILATRDRMQSELPGGATFDVEKPPRLEQRAAWESALSQQVSATEAGESAAVLAAQFDLDSRTIAGIAAISLRDLKLIDRASVLFRRRQLWDAGRSVSQPRLDGLARRIEPKARWGDIVLPEALRDLLRQIARQVAYRGKVYHDWGFAGRSDRGLGVTALFAGESGTGKTMAAEVLARTLRLDLYRIDLSAVVSKYIGETEKNLRRLFDAADDGGAILFFDEADALFGKRSEVKDSHDRYANIEINYLLQRMEAYRGLAILATNMRAALDSAFMRRLRFVLNFPFPAPADREQIWRKAFPRQMPLGRIDYSRLARLPLAGGNIHSIALNAAFLAAHSGRPLGTELVLAAARDEFIKLDQPVNEADFRYDAAEASDSIKGRAASAKGAA